MAYGRFAHANSDTIQANAGLDASVVVGLGSVQKGSKALGRLRAISGLSFTLGLAAEVTPESPESANERATTHAA